MSKSGQKHPKIHFLLSKKGHFGAIFPLKGAILGGFI